MSISQNEYSTKLDNEEIQKLNQKATEYSKKLNEILQEVKKLVVGQEEIIQKVLISMLANGHVILEGAPGLAKTLIIKTIADVTGVNYSRIQFTPDLLPADILGTKIYKNKTGTFVTQKGPIFHNLILADEINRAPPKVQSALLEAMQERQVSIFGETFELEKPFFVLATQNPLENEGTYKLPEAQIDRFAMKLQMNYPSKEEEKIIINRFTTLTSFDINSKITNKEILEIQNFTKKIYADETIIEYVADIVNATRNPEKYNLELENMIELSASPRASLWLILTAKVNAMLNGRGYVIPEDIKAVYHDVLRHRVLLTYEAEAKGLTSDKILDFIFEKIPIP